MAKHIYIAKAAGFSTNAIDEDGNRTRVKFEEGQFQTDDDSIAEQLDNAIAKKGLARHITKVDRAAAEALVAKHRAGMKAQGAMHGSVTALAASEAMKQSMANRDAELKKAVDGSVEGVLEVLAPEGGLVLTEEGVTAPSGETQKAEDAPAPTLNLGSKK